MLSLKRWSHEANNAKRLISKYNREQCQSMSNWLIHWPKIQRARFWLQHVLSEICHTLHALKSVYLKRYMKSTIRYTKEENIFLNFDL